MNQRAFFGGWKQTDIFGKTHLPKENKHIARGCERIASREPKRNGYVLFVIASTLACELKLQWGSPCKAPSTRCSQLEQLPSPSTA